MAQHKHVHKKEGFASRLGMSLSFLCAIHCLSMPFIIALLPTAGSYFHSSMIEGSVIGMSILLAVYTLYKDFRNHKRIIPILILGLGFIVVVSAFIYEAFHDFYALGGIIIFIAYVINWFQNRKFKSCAISEVV